MRPQGSVRAGYPLMRLVVTVAAWGCLAGTAARGAEPGLGGAIPGGAGRQTDGGGQAIPANGQESPWPSALARVDDPREGIVQQVVVSPRTPQAGQPVAIILSTKNVGARPLVAGGAFNVFPRVTLRGAAGEFVPWTERAPRRWGRDAQCISDVVIRVRLEPGCAYGQSLVLNPCFVPLRPGRYTGLVEDVDGMQMPVPFALEVRERDAGGSPTLGRHGGPAADESRDCSATAPFDERWRAAESAARREGGKLVVEAVLGRAGRDLNLVVSLKNTIAPVDRSDSLVKRDPHAADAIAVMAGGRAADYQVLVRGRLGREVPISDEGRAWWAKQAAQQAAVDPPGHYSTPGAAPHFLVSGEAVGALFPLSRMYGMQPGQEYEVLVMLPKAFEDGGPLAAGPIQFRH